LNIGQHYNPFSWEKYKGVVTFAVSIRHDKTRIRILKPNVTAAPFFSFNFNVILRLVFAILEISSANPPWDGAQVMDLLG
jgi:hypothetical protein